VDHVARLARLELSDEERDRFTRQLSDLLEYFAKLSELDTDDVEPASHVMVAGAFSLRGLLIGYGQL